MTSATAASRALSDQSSGWSYLSVGQRAQAVGAGGDNGGGMDREGTEGRTTAADPGGKGGRMLVGEVEHAEPVRRVLGQGVLREEGGAHSTARDGERAGTLMVMKFLRDLDILHPSMWRCPAAVEREHRRIV